MSWEGDKSCGVTLTSSGAVTANILFPENPVCMGIKNKSHRERERPIFLTLKKESENRIKYHRMIVAVCPEQNAELKVWKHHNLLFRLGVLT